MKLEECETCIKRKTVYCPTSIECMATDDKPYYQNRIMLLEENQKLKKRLEQYQEEVCILDMRTDENIKLINQQKEFIKWIESIKFMRIIPIEMVCDKYKKIIGDDK